MKKLANVSPFILLLVPVFVMMLLTFTTSINETVREQENIAVKSKTTKSNHSLIKVSTSFN